MNNKSKITLVINGRKIYTRNVMPGKKYTHAAVPMNNPTHIISCSTGGKFDRNVAQSSTILPVVWTDERNATVTLDLDADALNMTVAQMQDAIANREVRGYSVGEMNERLALVMDLWGDAIESENPVDAPETDDREEFAKAFDAAVGIPGSEPAEVAPKAKKAKKAKVSTETHEAMMNRFAGQCREMLRKVGAEKVEWLLQRAAADIANG